MRSPRWGAPDGQHDDITLWRYIMALHYEFTLWHYIMAKIMTNIMTTLWPTLWIEVAAMPSLIIFWLAIMIAVFKYSEMTFVPFILSFIRFKSNVENRRWVKWVDSFQPIDVWFLTESQQEKKEIIDITSKIDKIKELDEKLNKI